MDILLSDFGPTRSQIIISSISFLIHQFILYDMFVVQIKERVDSAKTEIEQELPKSTTPKCGYTIVRYLLRVNNAFVICFIR